MNTHTTKDDIKRWLMDAPKNATHMAVVCDTFDWEDYPVYILKGENVLEKIKPYENRENMTMLMELYNLSADFDKQINSGYLNFNL